MKPRILGPFVHGLLGIVIVVAVLVAGCTGQATTSSSATTPSSAAGSTASASESTSSGGPGAATSETAALTPKYGGTLRIVWMTMGTNIGWPAEIGSGTSGLQGCFETLLRSDNQGNVYPWLAESYQVADDRTSVTFNIRQGVKFHDGSDLNADVVKWNLEQYKAASGATPAGVPGGAAPPAGAAPPEGVAAGAAPPAGAAPVGAAGGGGNAAATWSSVEVVDPYTVKVSLSTWTNQTLAAFADTTPTIGMVSKAAYDKNGVDWMRKNPVGTGPFMVTSYQVDSKLTMVKNENYWAKDTSGNQLPYLDGIELVIIEDQMTVRAAIQAHEADMVQQVASGKPASDYAAMGLKIDVSMDANNVLVGDSAHADSPWAIQEVREAAEYAIDREKIAEVFGYGYWQPTYQIPCRASAAYDPDFSLARKYDLEKAKQLMAQAGYADGFKTTITAWPGASQDMVVAIQANLADIGIKADLKFPDMGSFVAFLSPTNGAWHNGLVLMPLPQQDASFTGALNFAFGMWGDNVAKSSELLAAVQAATSSPTTDVALVRAATDIMSKEALVIPVSEMGTVRGEYPYVMADCGQRGTPVFSNWESFWLNK